MKNNFIFWCPGIEIWDSLSKNGSTRVANHPPTARAIGNSLREPRQQRKNTLYDVSPALAITNKQPLAEAQK